VRWNGPGPPQNQQEFNEILGKESSSETSGNFIVIAAVVVLFVFGALAVTKIVLKNNHENMIQASNERIKRINEMEMERLKAESIHKDMIDHTAKTHGEYRAVPVTSFATSQRNNDEYTEQYNANHDFAIFQPNDKKVGGLMSVKEKQNIADSVGSDSLQSDRNSTVDGKQESLSKQIQQKIDDLELKKQKSAKRRMTQGLRVNSESPEREGKG